jgi:hypothetical protein
LQQAFHRAARTRRDQRRGRSRLADLARRFAAGPVGVGLAPGLDDARRLEGTHEQRAAGVGLVHEGQGAMTRRIVPG